MDSGARVRVVEGACDRTQQGDDAVRLVALAIGEQAVESDAVDQLGDQIRRFAFIRELVKTRDRLMLECRVGPKLEQEPPREAHIACDAGADRSQRNPAMKARMLGLIDGAEAVGVQLAQQAIPAYVLVSVGLRLAFAFGSRAVLVRAFLSHET